ncbi:hypothetical protein CAOG_07882 [Capsaspora owczarzaki ATCC 30864]|uniref:PARP catalytic domain-containing protein n=1 Tax=Capsaspora owczarzaki (strain ATCC 30864) TaxID=595528 RepID=A0A0D2WY45_CAPO3|nr:hypothetical protein CAOG_07882 [Capsaspora owczarzaki ATCC 30864]KJE97783.1 hypothetical protein CAOG_007882 [Capsaspora owczarzaki ATCC 30864]|eukprot:XP_004342967.1 hypothetical protein CAOG_07882 [Capsaspora owczarzaki ATCC 30864]
MSWTAWLEPLFVCSQPSIEIPPLEHGVVLGRNSLPDLNGDNRCSRRQATLRFDPVTGALSACAHGLNPCTVSRAAAVQTGNAVAADSTAAATQPECDPLPPNTAVELHDGDVFHLLITAFPFRVRILPPGGVRAPRMANAKTTLLASSTTFVQSSSPHEGGENVASVQDQHRNKRRVSALSSDQDGNGEPTQRFPSIASSSNKSAETRKRVKLGTSDQTTDASLPPCVHGLACTSTNLLHFAEFAHPTASTPAASVRHASSATRLARKATLVEQDSGEAAAAAAAAALISPIVRQATSLTPRLLLRSYTAMSESERRLVIQKASALSKELEVTRQQVAARNDEIQDLRATLDNGLLLVEGEKEALARPDNSVTYFPLYPSRTFAATAEQLHFRMAESQFHRLLEATPTNVPVSHPATSSSSSSTHPNGQNDADELIASTSGDEEDETLPEPAVHKLSKSQRKRLLRRAKKQKAKRAQVPKPSAPQQATIPDQDSSSSSNSSTDDGLDLSDLSPARASKPDEYKYCVTCVEYVVAPRLVRRFQQARQHMADQLGPSEALPVLAFHGTSPSNLTSICEQGFRMPGDPDFVATTDDGFFARGAYFSEYPGYAMGYIEGHTKLLVCQVLLGRSHRCTELILGQERVPGFDSHVSPDGRELVVFDSAHILPCYIVHFEKRSLAGGLSVIAGSAVEERKEALAQQLRDAMPMIETDDDDGDDVSGQRAEEDDELTVAASATRAKAQAALRAPASNCLAGFVFQIDARHMLGGGLVSLTTLIQRHGGHFVSSSSLPNNENASSLAHLCVVSAQGPSGVTRRSAPTPGTPESRMCFKPSTLKQFPMLVTEHFIYDCTERGRVLNANAYRVEVQDHPAGGSQSRHASPLKQLAERSSPAPEASAPAAMDEELQPPVHHLPNAQCSEEMGVSFAPVTDMLRVAKQDAWNNAINDNQEPPADDMDVDVVGDEMDSDPSFAAAEHSTHAPDKSPSRGGWGCLVM